MSLNQLIEDTEKELEEALKAEETEEVKEEEVEQEEPKTEEPKEEVVEEEKPKAEDDDLRGPARLRRDAKAAEKRAEEAENRAKQLEEELRTKESPAEVKVDPVSEEIKEFLQERTMSKAEREFMALENDFRKASPDYDAVAKAYQQEIYRGIYAANPRKSQEEVWSMTKEAIIRKAGGYAANGYNAAEEMYHDGKEIIKRLGISFEEKPKEEKPKPDMAKLAANRARSAGMAAAPGESKGNPTPKHVAEEYTAADVAKMSEEQFRAVMAQIRD